MSYFSLSLFNDFFGAENRPLFSISLPIISLFIFILFSSITIKEREEGKEKGERKENRIKNILRNLTFSFKLDSEENDA